MARVSKRRARLKIGVMKEGSCAKWFCHEGGRETYIKLLYNCIGAPMGRLEGADF